MSGVAVVLGWVAGISGFAQITEGTGGLPGRVGEMLPLRVLGHVVVHPNAPGHSMMGQGLGADREGNIYVLDTEGPDPFSRKVQIVKLDSHGQVLDRLNLPLPTADILWMTADPEGNLWITYRPSDSQGQADMNRLAKLDSQGQVLWQMPSQGVQLDCVATDAEGFGYVATSTGQAIYKIAPEGKFLTGWDLQAILAPLGIGGAQPSHVAVAPDGSVYVAGFSYLIKLDADGKLVKALPWGQQSHIRALAAGTGGKLYIATWAEPRLFQISDDVPVVTYLGLTDLFGHDIMQLNQAGLACDAAGNLLFVGYECFVKTQTHDLILWQLSP